MLSCYQTKADKKVETVPNCPNDRIFSILILWLTHCGKFSLGRLVSNVCFDLSLVSIKTHAKFCVFCTTTNQDGTSFYVLIVYLQS